MPETHPDSSRGVSEVLGYVFVFTLIVSSVGIVSVTGVASLNDVRSAEQVQNAETAFDVLHDNMAELYFEGAPSRATEISVGGSDIFFEENVTMNVTVVEGSETTVTEYEVRPLVHRLQNDHTLVYEAGAVFRTNPDTSLTVRDPPFVFRSETVHTAIPALQAPSVRSLGGGTVLVRAEITNRSVTVSDTDSGADKVVVNITSPRYESWESYLSDQPGVDCTVDDPENRVECTRDTDLNTVYVVAHEVDLTLIR